MVRQSTRSRRLEGALGGLTLEDGALVSVPGQHIIELAEAEDAEDADDAESTSKRCWNCGSTERDEDNECAKCHDPYPDEKPTGRKNGKSRRPTTARPRPNPKRYLRNRKLVAMMPGIRSNLCPMPPHPKPLRIRQPNTSLPLRPIPWFPCRWPKLRTPSSRPNQIPPM